MVRFPVRLLHPGLTRRRIGFHETRVVAFTSNGGAFGIVVTIPFIIRIRVAYLENLAVRRSQMLTAR